MGTRKDALTLAGGRTMLAHVAAAVGEVCRPVFIVGRPPPAGDVFIYDQFLADVAPGLGPLGGIATLLASGRADGYLVAACDQPYVTPLLLRRLIAGDLTRGRCFSAAGRKDREPLPAYFPASWGLLAARLLASGERSLRGLFRAGRGDIVALARPEMWQLFNVNTRAEFFSLLLFGGARRPKDAGPYLNCYHARYFK